MTFDEEIAEVYKRNGRDVPSTNTATSQTTSALTSALTNKIGNIGNIPGPNLSYGEDGRASVVGDFNPDLNQQSALTDYNSQFDTPYMDYAKMGIGGINSVMGIVGTLDSMKNNKLRRKEVKQNMAHAAAGRQDRTNFLNSARSAFAPKG